MQVRGRRTSKRKPRKALVVNEAIADLQKQVAALTREVKEARDQQTATSEVLQVISSSSGELAPVFESLLAGAKHLCGAEFGIILLREGDAFRTVALHGTTAAYTEARWRAPLLRPAPDTGLGRVLETRQAVQIADVRAVAGYVDNPVQAPIVQLAGVRSKLSVPMLKEGDLIGVIEIDREEVRPFTDRQIQLMQTFADQAVIAIENARLFNEVQTKTLGLQESLQQQTATADVLKLISRSAFDLQPVLDGIARVASDLCAANDVTILIRDGDYLRVTAHHGSIPMEMGTVRPINRDWVSGRAVLDRRPVHVRDLAAAEDYPLGRQVAAKFGHRTTLAIPLLRGDEAAGCILLRRLIVDDFTDEQIDLLQTFADQAVIAIENTRLFNETKQALERQTATADILKVIASSPSDVQPVFDTIAESARRLSGGHTSIVTQVIGDFLHLGASSAESDVGAQELRASFPIPISANRLHGRAALSGEIAFRYDTENEPDVTPAAKETARVRGYRSLLAIPMMREGVAIGTIGVSRREAGHFPDKFIELLRTFADQAVIAIENARLFHEVQAKTADLQESLQQQTATADVLKVISRSAFDLEPVLDALLSSACRLCEADLGTIRYREGGEFRLATTFGFKPEAIELFRTYSTKPDRSSLFGRTIIDGHTVHIPDLLADPDYDRPQAQKLLGFRAALGVPLTREGETFGVINLFRFNVGSFEEKQIELVQTFADQAVIAIENVRLFNETQEALERQTATADVLKIISRSSVELGSVLHTLVQTVARLCRADQVYMFHLRHDLWHLVADCGLSEEARDFFRNNPFIPGRGSTSGRAALERRAVLIPDVLQDPEYTLSEGQEIASYRTTLGIPLLREDTLIGVYSIARTRVEPFTDKEIELATTFADQAVIAIENARLFEELRDRQAELRVTFDNMGDGVVMFGADTRLVAWNRNFQSILDLPDAFLAERPSYAAYFRYLAERGEYSADLEADLSRANEDPRQELRLERTRPDGRIIEVRRNAVPDGGFVLIYADITDRKRAEEAIRLARDAAENALRDLQAAQDRLVQTEKLASLGQLTAGIAHEIKNPLNFVNNFSALSAELIDEMTDVFQNPALDDASRRKELDEIRQLLKSNLEKVVQHGKRADSIVKNMLLHSREGSTERRPAEVNKLVEESLSLAYHGARAEKAGFMITLKHDLDPDAGALDLYPQEMTRALPNLISNGFYAATKRKAEESDEAFEPVLSAATRNLGKAIEIRIRDNGTGIPPEVREKMFNPFFTTKPTGEGTGLGLSMTHDIIVKQHGGRIDVETEPGAYTEFIITLPRDGSSAIGKKPE